jgi:signal recognition particle subunit SRP54
MMSKLGGMQNIAKMLPGMGNQLNLGQIAQVEKRMKRSKAIICSMTRKERANPDLLIKDKTARSRLIRITKGSGTSFEDGQQFISEFQKMKILMSRMQKQMPQQDVPMSNNSDNLVRPEMGNRAMRRAAKKKPKTGRGGGSGFG